MAGHRVPSLVLQIFNINNIAQHQECDHVSLYIKSFGGRKGGSLEPPRTPPAYGPGNVRKKICFHTIV